MELALDRVAGIDVAATPPAFLECSGGCTINDVLAFDVRGAVRVRACPDGTVQQVEFVLARPEEFEAVRAWHEQHGWALASDGRRTQAWKRGSQQHTLARAGNGLPASVASSASTCVAPVNRGAASSVTLEQVAGMVGVAAAEVTDWSMQLKVQAADASTWDVYAFSDGGWVARPGSPAPTAAVSASVVSSVRGGCWALPVRPQGSAASRLEALDGLGELCAELSPKSEVRASQVFVWTRTDGPDARHAYQPGAAGWAPVTP
jgi:hypothetical protein